MTALVDRFVDEILSAAADADGEGKPTAVAIAAIVQKAYLHFKAAAGDDYRELGVLLIRLFDSLRLAVDADTHSDAARDLIRSGSVLVGIYLRGVLDGSRAATSS
jgi:hypothetical protein